MQTSRSSAKSTDLDHWISQETEYAQGQFISWIFGAFAALALVLAAVGLYSVVSYTVAERTNEFGIRMAIGALRWNVLGLVVRATAVSVGSGVALGLVLALLLHKGMTHWINGSADDESGLVVAVIFLAFVALGASAIPASRAARIELMEALRYE